MTMTLRTRLTATSLVLVSIPVVVLALLSVRSIWTFGQAAAEKSCGQLEIQARVGLEGGVRSERTVVDNFIGQMTSDARKLAGSPTLQFFLNPRSNRVYEDMAGREMGRLITGLCETADAVNAVLVNKLDSDLKMAEHLLAARGQVSSSEELHEWDATNQLTHATQQVKLPLLKVGNDVVRPVATFDQEAPVVDATVQVIGGTCTLFQRMNPDGDMIRVATNVAVQSGQRAIGTFIPVANKDGKSNPVIAKVLRGETYRGRAFVVNGWYHTAYAPLKNAAGEVTGMLYVGVPEQSNPLIKQLVERLNTGKVGDTGYVFVMNHEGTLVTHPKKDYVGKNTISDLKLSSFSEILGNLQGEARVHNYVFEGRDKFLVYQYYPEWDWVICASGYWDDLMRSARESALRTLEKEAKAFAACSVMTVGENRRLIYNQVRYIAADGQEQYNVQMGELLHDLKNKGSANWFKEACRMPEGQLYVAPVEIAVNTGKPEMRMAAPVYFQGKLNGLLVLSADWTIVSDTLASHAYGRSGYVYIIDSTGMLVAHPRYRIQDNMHLTDAKYGRLADIVRTEMIPGKQGTARYMFEGVEKLVSYLPVHAGTNDYSIAVGLPMEEALSAAMALRKDAEIQTWAGVKSTGWAAVILLGFGALIGWRVAGRVARPLQQAIGVLEQDAAELNDFAGQVSDVSQQLAQGASDQASSLEETSAALHETAATADTNARNASDANQLAAQAKGNAGASETAVTRLTQTMQSIDESSSQIGNIIKVIEEIAFQTNLLALNAAVEAARAGEHGRGFAVVAEEVRNLAQRSAQAARNTADLIESSSARVREGSSAVSNTAQSLHGIVDGVNKVADVLQNITFASGEQAQGIAQITTAMEQMDRLTQQNAGGSEQLAATSENLRAKATSLGSTVEILAALVAGRSAS